MKVTIESQAEDDLRAIGRFLAKIKKSKPVTVTHEPGPSPQSAVDKLDALQRSHDRLDAYSDRELAPIRGTL